MINHATALLIPGGGETIPGPLHNLMAFCSSNALLPGCAQQVLNPRINEAVERAIIKLRYGVIAVNAFVGMPFAFAAPTWGAYPGSTPDDIQSGSGFVHNTSMLEGVEKTVMRAPLTTFPKPAYFASHRTTHKMMRKIVAMEKSASWAKVPGIVFDAMRG